MIEENYFVPSFEKVSHEKLIFNELSSLLNQFKQLLILMNKSVIFFCQTEVLLMEENLKLIESTCNDIFTFLDSPTSWINSPLKSDHYKYVYF